MTSVVGRGWLVVLLVAAAGAAARAHATPAPSTVIADVARRGGTIADHIDAIAGVVIRDGSGVRRICGSEAALYAEAIDRSLRTQVGDSVSCSVRGALRICRLEIQQPSGGGDPNVALAFMRTAPGTLVAATWSEEAVTPATITSAIARADACPPPTTAPATPASSSRPAVVTRRLLRDLIDGRQPWASVIDESRGVTFLRYTSTEADPPVERHAHHRCGVDASRALVVDRRQLRSWMRDGHFECVNRPGPPTCELGAIGEFMSTLRFTFRPTAGGLVLDSVATINSVYEPFDQEPVLARLRARHLATTCPPP